MAKRGNEWVSFLRVLAILKRLMEGPATNEELIQFVLDTVGADAYPSVPSARQAAFKHDRANLKKRLGVDHVWDSKTNSYVLNDAGPYGRVRLSPPMLRALAILSRQYSGCIGGRRKMSQ